MTPLFLNFKPVPLGVRQGEYPKKLTSLSSLTLTLPFSNFISFSFTFLFSLPFSFPFPFSSLPFHSLFLFLWLGLARDRYIHVPSPHKLNKSLFGPRFKNSSLSLKIENSFPNLETDLVIYLAQNSFLGTCNLNYFLFFSKDFLRRRAFNEKKSVT